MAFDKLVIKVFGRLQSMLAEPSGRSEVFDSYRAMLRRRAEWSAGQWTSPARAPARFETKLTRSWGTIMGTALRATWADQEHELALTLTVNPTRTLIHALATIGEDGDAGSRLDALLTEELFAWSAAAAPATTLGGNDNAFDDVGYVISWMGRDHAQAFVGIFERKLKRWALEVCAPRGEGFSHDSEGGLLVAGNGIHRITLDWSRLFLRHAEIYAERHHGGAVALMNRLTSTVMASHAEADWRTYDIDEFGGRVDGSTVIGIKPTKGIEQVYYAKTKSRVRIETRFHHRVRDNLRGAPISLGTPLHDLLMALREEAAGRLRWDSFCAMAEEPPIPMVTDFARLAGVIARCAAAADVDPEPVFAELVGTGGLSETAADGLFPRRLMRRMAAEGLIHRASLLRRARPGQPRRHHLAEPYLTVARMIRRTFSQEEDTGPVVSS